MKRLTLLRHAKSDWDDPVKRDFDRPLNGRGERAAALIGQFAKSKRMEFDHLVASPAVRVVETLDTFFEGYGQRIEPLWDRRIYLASSVTLIDVIRDIPDSAESALLAKPSRPVSEIEGNSCARATPMSALAARSWYSASTTSGRRRSTCELVPAGSTASAPVTSAMLAGSSAVSKSAPTSRRMALTSCASAAEITPIPRVRISKNALSRSIDSYSVNRCSIPSRSTCCAARNRTSACEAVIRGIEATLAEAYCHVVATRLALGLVGVGRIGVLHARTLLALEGVSLTVADADSGRRQQLLRASARLFREKGYDGTSVRDIAFAAMA